MSQASLPGLAPELKIQIFKSMDRFSSVAILSSTSRTFHTIWKSNTRSICDAVLQRIIECPVEANVLLDAQDSSQQAVDDQDLRGSQEDQSPYQQAIKRSQRNFVVADTASLVLRNFDYWVFNHSSLGRNLSPMEQTHFIRAYYRANALALLSLEGIPASLISSWDMRDFKQVCEILFFLVRIVPYRPYLALVSVDGSESAGEWTMALKKFKTAVCRIQSLEQDFLAVAPSGHLSKPREMPRCYFIAYEQLAKTTGCPRGAQLADILPLLPEGALKRPLNLT